MSDNLIIKTHCRTLRAICDTQSYEELLDLSGKKITHLQNLGFLISVIYKCFYNVSLPFIWDYFKQKNDPYDLRTTRTLELIKCRTKTYGLNTELVKKALLWNKMPNQ